MADLLKKFSAAADTVKSNNNPVRVCVYGAFREHLKDINPDDLPENIQIIYESVRDRLTSVRPKGDIGEDEAGYLAEDILHMADVLKSNLKKL
jgi:hypothetical protein